MKGLCVDIKEGKLKDVIKTTKRVGNYCDAIKINLQAFLDFGLEEHKKINKEISKYGKYSIIDAKLGDIGHSNEKAFRFYEKAGYNALTFNPYSFNIGESVQNTSLDLYVLVLMSNPEALDFQKQKVGRKHLYEIVAEKSVEAGAYGVVVGATVDDDDYARVKKIVRCLSILHPGVGVQKGKLRENCLNAVGRSITQAENVEEKAKWYYERTRY
jgi:orotidine-5'-phosphate decarboxylase